VVIEGLPEDVKRAYELVFETIEKNKREKEETPYRSSRSVAPPAAEKAETPARQPREQPKKTYKKEESAGDSSSNDTQKWGAPRSPKYAGSAKSPSPAPPVAAAGGAAAPGENGDATEKVDEVRIEVPFPADKTGLVFGKEGATVKHIKRKSRARVHVDTKKLVVELRGSQAQVEAAKQLIADVLAREPKHKPEAAAAGAAGAAVVASVAAPAEPKAERAAPAEAKGAEQQK
jgi:hypothetical protein